MFLVLCSLFLVLSVAKINLFWIKKLCFTVRRVKLNLVFCLYSKLLLAIVMAAKLNLVLFVAVFYVDGCKAVF